MRFAAIREILLLHDSGIWATEEDVEGGISILRSTNFTDDGQLDFSNLAIKAVAEKERATKLLRPGDVLLEKSGGGPKQPVGRVCYFKGDTRSHVFGNFVARLRADEQICCSEYLFLCLLYLHKTGVTSGYQKQTTGIRNLELKRYLGIGIPLPPLTEQRRIVDLLNHAADIRCLRQQALATARELIPALFVEMFGDPASNPKGWGVVELADVAEIGSGVTKGRNLEGYETVELPYLRVANVQDGRLDLADIKTIRVKPSEIIRFSLSKGDLLMTEGGDPDKLGRCAIWSGEVAPCLHQNHIFRVRCNPAFVMPEYVSALVGSWYGKRYFLQVAKQTTGIASINKTQLRGFPVLAPPLQLQQQFESRCSDARSLITQQERHLAQAEALLQSLMSRFFGGAGDKASVGTAPCGRPSVGAKSRGGTHRGGELQSPVHGDQRAGLEPAATESLPLVAEAREVYATRGQAALPAANQPVPARILAVMRAGRDYSRAELLAATGVAASDWTWAIRQLKEQRKVAQRGNKRGAQYLLANNGAKK